MGLEIATQILKRFREAPEGSLRHELTEAEREREQLVQELRRALRGSERRFEAIVGSLVDAVTIRDREHRFLYANRAAIAHLGFDSWEQLRETPPAQIMKDYMVWDEHGEPIAMEDIPSVRILRGEPAEPLLIRTVHRETGAQRWNLLKAAPLLDEAGEVEATITIIEEVTERMQAELRAASIARTLQQSLLPEQLPEIEGYELASIYLPGVETSMVGGDFYDVWAVRDSWLIAIGDVTGKGIDAAALTALVRHTLRTASEFDCSPARLLELVDGTLKKRPVLSLCTAMCVRLRRDEATLAVGGHPLPLLISSEGVAELGEHGPLLGAFPDVRWREHAVRLEPGSTVLAYTDGITDAQDQGDRRFGFVRLREALAELRGRSAADVVEGLARRLADFQAGAHTDDTAAIALRRAPAGAAGADHGEAHEVTRAGTAPAIAARA
jgi:sigma-B regulation protein RsbU (phosphoserine phosphatase)